jgi:uncharacterized protein (TIGR03000 family)
MKPRRAILSLAVLSLAVSHANGQFRNFQSASPPPTLSPILPSSQPPILPAPTIYPAQVPTGGFGIGPAVRSYPYRGGYFGGWGVYDGGYGYGYNRPVINNITNNYILPEPALVPRNNAFPPLVNEFPDVARLTLQVPIGAEVAVNGKKIDMAGSRVFTSPTLRADESFTFDVAVSWMENGKLIEQKRSLAMKRGESQSVQYLALPPAPITVDR